MHPVPPMLPKSPVPSGSVGQPCRALPSSHSDQETFQSV
jgi:hypothetical protein